MILAVLLTVAFSSGLIGCGPPLPDPAIPNAQASVSQQASVPNAAPASTHDAVSEQPSTYLVLRLKQRRLEMMREDAATPIASFPIAIGRAGHDTPTGRFQVEEMVEYPDFDQIDPGDRMRVIKRIPPGPENPLGDRWIGFAHGYGWTVGIHGTPHPELLGQAVSGGCIRMRNADVIRVYESVKLGTPVIVYP